MLFRSEKPILTIFNKIDLYEEKNFDDWLSEDVKQEIHRELQEKWNNITEGNCIFTSATEKTNLDELRAFILQKVREIYLIRYPYKPTHF